MQEVQLLPHQQRVVEEAQELESKLAKLDAFMEDERKFWSLSARERGFLQYQGSAMRNYLWVLKERIAFFKEQASSALPSNTGTENL